MLIGVDASRAAIRQKTGTEAYAYYLIQALIPLIAARGHRLRLYFNQPPADNFFASALETTAVEPVVLPFPRLWTHLRLGRELRQRPPDIFFTPAHVIPITYRGSGAATVHDLGYHFFPEAHTRWQRLYLRWSTAHNARRSRHLIADSAATKQDLVQLYRTPAAKVTVVYPGPTPGLSPVVDPDQLAAVQRRYGVTGPYLLFLGTLQPRKNLVRLVRAFSAGSVPHQLVLAGKPGWHGRTIHEAIAQLPPAASTRIHLPGFIDEDDKAALLSGATALLYPSLYEGFGFPILEAQACGTAVLCANNSSLPEVAGEGALFVDAHDEAGLRTAIERISGDETMRDQLVIAGFENSKRFTWDRAATQVLAVLEAAVTRSL